MIHTKGATRVSQYVANPKKYKRPITLNLTIKIWSDFMVYRCNLSISMTIIHSDKKQKRLHVIELFPSPM